MIFLVGEGYQNRPAQVIARQVEALMGDRASKAYHRFKDLKIAVQVIMEGYTKRQVQYLEFCVLRHYNLNYLANKRLGHNPFSKHEWAAIPDDRRSEFYTDLTDPFYTEAIARYVINRAYELVADDPPVCVDMGERYDVGLDRKDEKQYLRQIY